jgi:hypothetical protein
MLGFDTASDQLFLCYYVGGHSRLGGVDGLKIVPINKLRVITGLPFFQIEQLYIPVCERP